MMIGMISGGLWGGCGGGGYFFFAVLAGLEWCSS